MGRPQAQNHPWRSSFTHPGRFKKDGRLGRGHGWLANEESFLKRAHLLLSSMEIARKLHRTRSAIMSKLHVMGLTGRMQRRQNYGATT